MLKVYLRCIVLTQSKELASQLPVRIFSLNKSKLEVHSLEKLTEFIQAEIDYLFMKKRTYFMLHDMNVDRREDLTIIEAKIETIFFVLQEAKKQNDFLLNLLMERKLSSSHTNSIINMTLSMQKMEASLKMNQPNSFKDAPESNISFANRICAELLIDIQKGDHDQLLYKLELFNGILKLFMDQGVGLYESEIVLYEYDKFSTDGIQYFTQIDLLLTQVFSQTFGNIIIQFLIHAQNLKGQNQKESNLRVEIQFSLLYILRSVSILGSGFMGIQNS
jgi:hypothetical protein